MKKIVWVLGLTMAILTGCTNQLDELGDEFTGTISELTLDHSFIFFGYQLDDVTGFERHPIIDTVHFYPNSHIQLPNNFEIKVDNELVYIQESMARSTPFRVVVDQGSTIINETIFKGLDGTRYAMLVGVKNGKTWVGRFDTKTRKQLQEWNAPIELDRNFSRTYPEGDVNFRYHSFFITGMYATPAGYSILLSSRYQGRDYDVIGYLLEGDTAYQFSYNELQGEFYGVHEWNDNNHLLCQLDVKNKLYHYTVLSNEGEELGKYTWNDFPENYYPINNTEWISLSFFEGTVSRFGFDKKEVWKSNIPELVSSNYYDSTHKLISKQGNIWEFEANVFKGNQGQYKVQYKINVDNGSSELLSYSKIES